jgi:hypothetical protein
MPLITVAESLEERANRRSEGLRKNLDHVNWTPAIDLRRFGACEQASEAVLADPRLLQADCPIPTLDLGNNPGRAKLDLWSLSTALLAA